MSTDPVSLRRGRLTRRHAPRRAPLVVGLVGASLHFFACGAQPEPVTPAATSASSPMPPARPRPRTVVATLAEVGLDGEALDRGADPCDDFYRFACGGWIAKTKIPPDRSYVARSFTGVGDRTEGDLHQILDDAAAGRVASDAGRKLGAFYSACMDEAATEKAQLAALAPVRRLARAVRDVKSLGAAIAALHLVRRRVVFELSDQQDLRDATRVVGGFTQGGLSLPDRDFYTRDDDASKELRKKHLAHVERLLALAGTRPAEAKAAARDTLLVETELAKISKTGAAMRDVEGLHNRLERKGLQEKAPHFPWEAYFQAVGAPGITEINVTSVPFVEGMDRLFVSLPPAVWAHYLEAHAVMAGARWGGKRLEAESFSGDQILTGQVAERPRWKRCVDATADSLGELLGQLFVEKRFGQDSKDAADVMVAAIRRAFAADVSALEWMDAPTRERALAKASAITYLVGRPARWRTYDFEVSRTDLLGNLLAARRHDVKQHLAKVGKPVDREEWWISVSDVDAQAELQKLQMLFPAGILQPPFFSKDASMPVNLGAIGSIIGHELTHHFDDQGSAIDARGNMASWWTPEAKARFDEKGRCVVDQYGAYEAVPGVRLDGALTLGENIADIGGLKIAFAAHRAMRADASEVTVAEGFDEDQQLFLSYGQTWCAEVREELARTTAHSDVHAAPRWRVNGVLSDTPQFAAAFHCAAGKAMVPAKPCAVW